MTIPSDQHHREIVDQFSKQAIYFSTLPNHEDATELLLRMADIRAADNVLDVACGAGAVACAAARTARHVTGIDLTPAMISRAEALQATTGHTNLTWHVGDVERLPYSSNSFDAVVTRYSLHHFLRPAAVLAEMARVCKPTGRVAVADLVLSETQRNEYDAMERLRDPSHIRVLTEQELGELMVEAGLIDLRWSGYLFELDLRSLLQASFPREGDADRVRITIEADVGVNRLGINANRDGEVVRIAYPIAITMGRKSSGDCD